MLKKVRFKNYKSFTQETIIDLEASKSEILQETNTNNNILKGVCFYGPNASGKTNALSVITLLFDMLLSNKTINFEDIITHFNKNKTAYFEYTFDIENHNIKYYFEVNRESIITKETLFIDDEILLNRLLDSAESKINGDIVFDATKVDKKTLFLKTIRFNTGFPNYPILSKLFELLTGSFNINLSIKYKFEIYSSSNTDLSLYEYLKRHGDKDINEFFKEFNFPYSIEYRNNEIEQNQILFKRKNMESIPYQLESYGNQVLITLLPVILSGIKNNSIIMIDEFSSGLHNQLEELLIKYIYKHSESCQLFFVSHSTNLLKTSILRPDQIYAVDFDEKGSFITKFSDEHPRESQNLEKMYLSGVFGGIPLYESNNK